MKKLFTCLVFLFLHIESKAFETLSQAVQYAQLHPEYPTIKDSNLIKLNYYQFYKKEKLSLFSRMLEYIHQDKKVWSPRSFKNNLYVVVKDREKRGYSGNFILVNTPQPETHFVVMGPLLGAFHSLVRTLQQLKILGIIDDNLRFLKQDYYLIFNGNVINGAPYVLETLTLVLSLMKKNPTTILYIKGRYESNEYWHNTALKEQLKVEAQYLSKEKIPLSTLITRFFDTLPLGLYLNSVQEKHNFLRISYFSLEDNRLSDITCGKLFQSKHSAMDICKVKPYGKEEKVPIKAIVKAEDRLISYRQNPGIMLLEPEQGATAWSLFSSPNKIYKENYSFFYDAFVIITIGKNLSETSITLYNQDVRDLLGFKLVSKYNIITGQSLISLLNDQPLFGYLFAKDKIAESLPMDRIQ